MKGCRLPGNRCMRCTDSKANAIVLHVTVMKVPTTVNLLLLAVSTPAHTTKFRALGAPVNTASQPYQPFVVLHAPCSCTGFSPAAPDKLCNYLHYLYIPLAHSPTLPLGCVADCMFSQFSALELFCQGHARAPQARSVTFG